MTRFFNTMLIMGFLLISLMGCKSTISNIKSDPESWQGNRVTIKGICTSKQVIPFTSFYIYTIESSGDSIQVLTQDQWFPGRRYQLEGQVEVLAPAEGGLDSGYNGIISLLIGDGGFPPLEARYRAEEIMAMLTKTHNQFLDLVFLIQIV